MTLSKRMSSRIHQLLLTTTVHGSPSIHISALPGIRQLVPDDPSAHRPTIEDATSLALTMTNILKDVAETTEKLPYINGIAGTVSQLLQIRQELQAHSKRCNELLEKVLRNGTVIIEQCAMLKGYREEGRLDPFFQRLGAYYSLLNEVYRVLQMMRRRKFFDRLFNRGLDELTELDRKIESFGKNVDTIGIAQILAEIKIQREDIQNTSRLPASIGPITHLPPEPVRILERREQREAIVAALLSSSKARIAILGMGGIGKTTLACSTMRDPRVSAAYPRQLFISFEGLSTPELVYNSLANTFDIPTESRKSSAHILEQVIHHLGQEKTILCVDNFETFWEDPKNRRDADDFIGQLALLPTLAIIVTLRGIQGPGTIAWRRLGPLLPLTQGASKALVREIAQGEVEESSADVLQDLLEAVAGVPLAVTLIGNLLRDGSESLSALWHRWNQERTRAIGTGIEDRQYRLDVSLKLSVFGPRMTDESRAVLTAIAVLPAGLSSEEAWLDKYQALLPPSVRLRDCLQSLRNTALCSLDKQTSPPRYQLLSPVRQFCLTQENLPLDVEAIQKLIDLYSARLYDDPRYSSSTEYAWFTYELTNITAILNFALSLPHPTDTLAYACSTYTRWMLYLGSPTTDIICKTTNAQPEGSKGKAKCLQVHGYALRLQGQNEEAMSLLQQAWAIHTAVGDTVEEALDLVELGNIHRALKRRDDAEGALTKALMLYRGQKDRNGEANCLFFLADVYNNAGELSEAESSAKDAVEIYRSISDRLGEANALSSLGWVYRRQGQVEKAIEMSEKAYEISMAIKYTYGQARAMYFLGLAHKNGGNLDRAASCFRESIRLFDKCSALNSVQRATDHLSQVLSKLNPDAEVTEMDNE